MRKSYRGAAGLVAGGHALGAALLALFQFGLWSDRLPDPVAVHFTLGGTADGFLGPVWWYLSCLALLVAQGALFGALVILVPEGGGRRRLVAAIGTGMAVLLTATPLVVLWGNLDVADAGAVTLSPWWVGGCLAVAVLVGAVVRLLMAADPESDAGAGDRSVSPVSALRLAGGETAVWSRTIGSRVVAGVAYATALAGVPMLLLGSPVGAAVMVLTGLLCGLPSSARVTVDARGLAVSFVGLPWPRKVIPVGDVVAAGTRQVSALGEFGGWGYRVTQGATGVIMRSGEALWVRRRGGREFVVTTRDAETAAALLNGLAARASRVEER